MISEIYSLLKKANELAGSYNVRRLNTKVCKVLLSSNSPDTARAESCFDVLQNAYPSRTGYGYDRVSLWQRATIRSLALVSLPGMDSTGKKILEVGAGDGMLGVALNAFGHATTLIDQEDWRAPGTSNVEFHRMDCCGPLPFKEGTFDLACSYNAFEHLPDPNLTFNEMVRVVRPGGLLRIEFNPLYGSPWGLHAYRTLRMPYLQFLFSDEFIKEKIDQMGCEDLGQKRTELQFVNRWRPSQYERLWEHTDCILLECRRHVDNSNLKVVVDFPEAFQGRLLDISDLTIAGYSVTLQKKITLSEYH